MIKQILIIEDDPSLNEGIGMTLESSQIRTVSAENLKQAREELKKKEPDLVLLDVNLPDGDGFSFCREIREQSDVPIIFLTAKDLELDIVRGLEMGGDDYITKPFSLMVLRARVHSVLRRRDSSRLTSEKQHTFRLENLTLDFENMVFTRDGESLNLSKTEQKLLKILVMNRGRTLSKEQLIDRVWETEYVDDHALTVTIKRLRDKLGTTSIKSIYGIGYTWAKGAEME